MDRKHVEEEKVKVEELDGKKKPALYISNLNFVWVAECCMCKILSFTELRQFKVFGLLRKFRDSSQELQYSMNVWQKIPWQFTDIASSTRTNILQKNPW